jgi:hypothetical protein
MLPVFFLTALLESWAICCSICSRTVLIGDWWISGRKSGGKDQTERASCGELAGDGGLVNVVADANAQTGDAGHHCGFATLEILRP